MNLTSKAVGTTTIGRKLFLSFGISVALTLLIAVVGFINDAILESTVERVVASTSARQAMAGEISLDFEELLSLERGMYLRAMMKDNPTVDTYNREYLEHSNRLTLLTHQLAPLLLTEKDKQLCSQLVSFTLQLRHLHDLAYMQIAAGDMRDTNSQAYITYLNQYLPQANIAKSQATLLLEDQLALIQQESLGAHRTEVRSRYLTSFMLMLFFIVGGVLARIVAQSSRTLCQFAVDLGLGATKIAAAAAKVATSSQSLARGASQQAAFIEQTSASAEDIAAMARRNTRNAQTTASMVAGSQRYIVEGNQSLDRMVSAMDGIAASSRQISKIVKLIDQIAFQTNVLALNSAAAAARAGEAGLSFAVVADEIRELALRTAQAAKDTAGLIEDCIGKSQAGKLEVDGVAAAIRSITNESAKINLLVDEIHRGSHEQSRGVDQVSKAVLQMEKVTQDTAAGAEQSAEAAGQLNTQFQTLKEIAHDLAAMLGSAIPEEVQALSPAPPYRAIEATAVSLPAVHEPEVELQTL